MRRIITLLCFIAISLTLAPASLAAGTNTFAGLWSGRWNGGDGQTGALALTVTAQGVLGGTVNNETYHITGNVQGVVNRNGAFTGYVQYPGQPASALNGAFIRVAGTAVRVTGMFTQNLGGSPYHGAFALSAQNPHPLAGPWRGPWRSGSGNNGTVILSIAADGSGSGTVRNNSLHLNGTIVLQVGRRGRFTGTVRYNNGETVNVVGTLKKLQNTNNRKSKGTFTEFDPGFPGGTFTLTRTDR